MCTSNVVRSVSGERLYAKHHECRSAGTEGMYTWGRKVTREDLEWADVVLCMEPEHREKLRKHGVDVPIRVLGIPDDYANPDDPHLTALLRERCEQAIPALKKCNPDGPR